MSLCHARTIPPTERGTRADCAPVGVARWPGNLVLSSPCEGASSTLEITAKKKAAAILAGLELSNPTNPCVALSLVVPALTGCSAVLPLLGAAKITVNGSPAAVFVCSGWAGPDKDEMVMLAALEKAGFKNKTGFQDGTWSRW